MYLFEFDETEPLVDKIVAATGQLKNDLDKGKVQNWTVDQLLDYYQKYDVILDPTDLYQMIQKHPLKSVISNIQGDQVVFKGQQQAANVDMPPTDDKKVVKQMAKKALKKKK